MAPPVGFEPTTQRLTAACSTTELQGNDVPYQRTRHVLYGRGWFSIEKYEKSSRSALLERFSLENYYITSFLPIISAQWTILQLPSLHRGLLSAMYW